jgi:hypothetical protein
MTKMFGEPIKRVEDRRLVMEQALLDDPSRRAGAALVRSPHAHTNRRHRCHGCPEVDGLVAIYTYED